MRVAGAAKRLEPVCRGEMDDVGVRLRLKSQRVDHRDRFILRHAWTGGEVARVRTVVAGRRVDVLRQLRVDEQRCPGSVQGLQRLFHTTGIEMAKLRYSRFDHETFEAAGTGIEHGPKLAGVSRHRATPERHVDAALAMECMNLRLERRHRGRRRDRVQRHVDDRRHPARGRRARRRLEPLPLCPPRLVDVYV